MKKRYVILFSSISFVTGLALADPISSVTMLFKSERVIECATENICVGNPVSKIFGLYESDPLGGLTGIHCRADEDARAGDYISIKDIVAGSTCKSEDYSLIYSTEYTRTVIRVKSDTIYEIRRGPRHILDL